MISNSHPDTSTHVWTLHGYMPRAQLVRSAGTDRGEEADVDWVEYRITATQELVRRDAHAQLKKGLEIGATINFDQGTPPHG